LKDCPAGAVFLAAVSGGADSMAMLAALCALQRDALQCDVVQRRVFCLHVEHGLRPAEESQGDADYVREFCKSNNIKCSVVSVPPGKIAALAQRRGIGIEAAARHFRHKALSREAARLDQSNTEKTIILLAHTKDDLLEMALMRILRGVGPAGLAAMPVRRGRIFRPLLGMSRADIIAYLKEKKIQWREDSTNSDEVFLRNKIRCRLVPMLNESFPSWKKGAAAMAETQSLAADFIAKEASSRIKWEISPNECFIFICAESFFKQPQIVREEAIYQGLNTLSSLRASVSLCESSRIKSVKRSVVRKFCSGAVNAADLGPVRARRKDGKILLSRTRKECFETGISVLIK